MSLDYLISRRKVVQKYKELDKLFESKKIWLLSYKEIYILLKFMFELTPKWFEEYIWEYFKLVDNNSKVSVVGWINDWWVDIRVRKDWHHCFAIQCKKQITSHTTKKDIINFIDNTKKYKELYRKKNEKLDLYFITTNRYNKEAFEKAKEWNVVLWNYKTILKINKKFSINNFIKKHKWNDLLLSWIISREVLDKFYWRKITWNWLFWNVYFQIFDFFYKNIILKFTKLWLDHCKLNKEVSYNSSDRKLIR